MARIRSIKPEFFSHEILAAKSAHARLLAIGLLTLADCDGRIRWVPMQVHSQVFPWEASVNIEVLLGELLDVSYVIHYVVDGKRYVQIPNFRKHQRLTGKEAAYSSLLPPPPEKPCKSLVKSSEASVKHSDVSRGSTQMSLGTGEHRNIGTGEQGNSIISSEPVFKTPEPQPSECKFPVFPTCGKRKTWTATQSQLEAWQECYPAIDVNVHHKMAHAWVMANLARRKTASGMARFLNAWFAQRQDKAPATSQFAFAKPKMRIIGEEVAS